MPQITKYNTSGQTAGELDLEENIFAQEVKEHVVHTVIDAQLAKARQGSASTKTRSEVRGGGRKPWRQKGTGRARHGSIRSPLWVGGGITFGPKPRSYEKNIPKRMKGQALKSILTDKYNTDSLIVLDELSLPEIKTGQIVELMENLKLEDSKVLILLPGKDENIYLSARNLPNVDTLVMQGLNAYDLLDNDYIVMSEATVRKLEEVLG